MAKNQLISSDEPDLFLEYLLRCALTAPGAETSPTAGRILARLLVVGAIEGGDELITPYLVPMPDGDATFEVRSYRPGDLVPTEVRDGLRAAAALKIALRSARDSDEGIEVVSRTESGLERCVLVRDSTGDFEFRFASPETLIGAPAECAAARRSWEATLAGWRAWVPTEEADPTLRRPAADPTQAYEEPDADPLVAPTAPEAPVATSGARGAQGPTGSRVAGHHWRPRRRAARVVGAVARVPTRVVDAEYDRRCRVGPGERRLGVRPPPGSAGRRRSARRPRTDGGAGRVRRRSRPPLRRMHRWAMRTRPQMLPPKPWAEHSASR